MKPILKIYLQHECGIRFQNKGEWLTPIAFSGMVLTLFPFVFEDIKLLQTIGIGLLWITCLFANLLSAQHLLEKDHEDGTLEQLQISGLHPASIIMGKILCHWMLTGLPLSLLSPLIMQLFYIPTTLIVPLITTLLVGSFVLSILGTLSSTLVLGNSSNSVLGILLTMPLSVPVLILATNTLYQLSGEPELAILSHFLWLMAGLILTLLPLTLIAGTMLLRD